MRKNFRMYLTLALVMLGVMSVNAQELVSLQEVPFTTWTGGNDGYGKDATAGEAANCDWVIGEPSGQPYGDSQVINGADLSLYSKLIINYTEGTPRVLLNRDMPEGQWNGDEAQSKLIEYPKDGGWSQKYFNDNGSTLIVDLKQIMKDKGYVRLHAIKGANWGNVTVTSMELERQGKAQQIGWTNLINNSDMEGDDVSSFFTKISQGAPEPSVITDGIGVDGSRGIMVAATAKVADNWDNQFWFRFNEPVPAGTKYRVSFDYRADTDADTETQAHNEPSDYIHWDMFGNINFSQNWQTFSKEGEVTAEQSPADHQFLSVAFNLNAYEGANNYYFDNVKFEVYKYGTVVEFDMDVIQVDFGFDTNIPDLVKAGGKPRLMFPEGTVTVKVNGEPLEITSVEGFADGRFYIFHEEGLGDGDEVEVTFTNPADPAYHIIYTSGPGGDANNFTMIATNNPDVAVDDAYSYLFETPVILNADPEDGSFNLPNGITEFKITFDKNVDCAALVAKLDNVALTVTPAEGAAEEVTLTRTGGDLTNGEHVLTLDKVYPEPGYRLADEIFGTYTLTLNIGKVEFDPNDVPKEMLAETFNECEANNIPEGYFVKFGEEDRPGGTSAGSGPRMFDFGGGDFTKGLYFREGYVEYGSMEGYALTLQEGKKYQVRFNSAMWKDNGGSMRFEIFNEAKEQVLVQMITNNPNLNGGQGAVNGSTVTTINFIPETTGNYVVRWTSAGSVDGDPGYMEIVLANPSVKYIPNAAGVEETNALNTALEEAKSIREANSDDRYAGEAFNALDAAIKKYEAEKDGYTAPSKYWNAVEDLTALTDAVKTHRTNCDNYDLNLSKAIDLVAQYGETKFKVAAEYIQLKEVTAKYEGKVLTDDAELTAAVAELTQIVDLTSYLFTEGESKRGDEGIKVLVERIRLGAEALKALGVSEDDELIVAANNAVSDDDDLADAIKKRIAVITYGNMKEANSNGMFAPVVDDETLEETTPLYDMTVFVKNPNIYAINGWKNNIPEENVPGWSVPTNNCEVNSAWTGTQHQVEGLASDMAFTKYHQNMRIEQTIGDLPAGIYTVIIDAVSWADDPTDGGYVFLKTSDTPAAEEGEEEQFAQKIDLAYWGQYVANHDNVFENVVVTDGILTLGVNFGPSSQYEFDKVKIYLAAPATGVDYSALYGEAVTGIDGTEAQAKVRAIQLYDLNGNRITTARKGIVIVKKIMNDGSVRTEKVIKK